MREIQNLRRKVQFVNMFIITIVIIVAFVSIDIIMKRRIEMSGIDVLHRVIMQDETHDKLSSDDSNNIQLPYFVLSIDQNHDISIIGGRYYTLTDESKVEDIVSEVKQNKEEMGILQSVKMRFLRIDLPHETRIACIEYSFEKKIIENITITLIGIGVLVWITFFVICFILSSWIVKPVEQAWKQQRQFIADASHELKTPVTVIASNAELLETEKQVLSQDGKRWLGYILDESMDMKTLVEDLLNTARYDEQKKLTLHKINISNLVTECALEFDSIFYQAQKELNMDIQDELYIMGNENSIRQLMKILLDNAIKYTNTHDKTEIFLQKVKHGKVLLIVASQGEEIPKEKRKAIFQRFFRLNEARDDRKGYGIGLSIAKQIALEHKGKIYVKSIDGWNRFCIRFRK